MMKQFLKNSLTEVLLTFSIQRSQIESMMKIDFKIGNERTNLMQLCFSNLAAWPLLLVIGLFYFDPTKNNWSLQQSFLGTNFSYWLLDGRLGNMALFFGLFFLLQWVFRKESLFIAVIFYFLLKSDIHFHLAIAGISAVIFSRTCYLWWMHTDLQSRSRKMWITFSTLQLCSWLLATVIILFTIDRLQFNQFFSESVIENRFEITFLSLLGIYLLQFIFTSVWGHFSFKRTVEPSEFPINYSTAHWILRFRMRPYFTKQITEQTDKYLKLHQENLEQLKSIKDLSPVSIPFQINNVLQTEIEHLKLASSRLTIQ